MKLQDVNEFNLHKVPVKQVYEWVKTGQWSQKDFKKWFDVIVETVYRAVV